MIRVWFPLFFSVHGKSQHVNSTSKSKGHALLMSCPWGSTTRAWGRWYTGTPRNAVNPPLLSLFWGTQGSSVLFQGRLQGAWVVSPSTFHCPTSD
jgi:hypothetical protein